MCRLGTHHDFHGIGVANLIFGLMCIILPDHALYEESTGDYDFEVSTGDFIRATDAITVINGIFFLAVGICAMVLARRWMENLKIHLLMQVTLILAAISIIICPITFILNIFATLDAADDGYTISADTISNSTDATTDSSSTSGAIPIDQVNAILTLFMYASRYLDYRYAICATFSLIAFGEFFMNIALLIIILKTQNFRCFVFGRGDEPQLDLVRPSSSINYHNMGSGGGAVVIEPLPQSLPPRAEAYRNGTTTATHVVA
jgi:hypothetical protein